MKKPALAHPCGDALSGSMNYHDPCGDFHQVDIYFRCTVIGSAGVDPLAWQGCPKGLTRDRRWVTRDQMRALRVKPGQSFAKVAI